MSEAKFYTPDISELHVGFECQLGEAGYWMKFTCGIYIYQDAVKLIRNNEIRVKHLDHDDIVECGWPELIHVTSCEGKWYRLGEINLQINFDTGYVHIFTGAIALNQYKTLFSGHLLNISELRRLMRQLGINKLKEA
jgi:hypothetical protein